MDVFSALGKRRRRKGVHIFTMVLAVDFSILTMQFSQYQFYKISIFQSIK